MSAPETRGRRRFIDIRRDELEPTLLFFSFWFLVIVVFWVLKPLKTGFFIEQLGARMELYAKLGNIGVAVLAVWLFSALFEKLGSRRLLLALCALFIAALVWFALTLGRAATPPPLAVWSFYLFGDAWSTIWVSAFWAYLNEMTVTEQSKRLYGFIGGGGIVGGLVGTTIVAAGVKSAGPAALLFGAAAGTLAIGLLTWRIEVLARRPQAPVGRGRRRETVVETEAAKRPRRTAAALEGARLAFSSRYLLAIVAIVLLYEFASQVLDYQFKTSLEQVEGTVGTQAYFARIGVITNSISILTQFFLVSLVIRIFGITAALLVLPVAMLAASGVYFAVPALWAASLLTISDNSLAYSMNQTSRETLFVPTPADVQYKARAFANMFVQRLGKGGAILVALALPAIPVRQLSWVAAGVILIWAGFAWYAGRRFDERTRGQEAAGARGADPA